MMSSCYSLLLQVLLTLVPLVVGRQNDEIHQVLEGGNFDRYETRSFTDGTTQIAVQVFIDDQHADELRSDLLSLGETIFDLYECKFNQCDGYLTIKGVGLERLEQLSSVEAIYPIPRPKQRFPPTTKDLNQEQNSASEGRVRVSEGDNFGNLPNQIPPTIPGKPAFTCQGTAPGACSAFQIGRITREFKLTGKGVKVCVISDSFDKAKFSPNSVSKTYADDIKSGDLPNDVQILMEATSGEDEGRAMAQNIYDVAPGAKLMFHTDVSNKSLKGAIEACVAAGAKIIADDVGDITQPIYQQGINSRTVSDAVKKGVSYFVASGNSRNTGWTSPNPYTPGNCPGYLMSDASISQKPISCHKFENGETQQYVQLTGSSTDFTLYWDDPWKVDGGVVSPSTNLDFYVYYSDGTLYQKGVDTNTIKAYESVTLNGEETINLYFVIGLVSGPTPKYMKWLVDGSPTVKANPPAFDNLLVIHGNNQDAAVVAASEINKQDIGVLSLASYSSKGGVPIIFDLHGNRLQTPITPRQVRFTGPDNVLTTFFSSDSGNRFSGTSCATPNVAAVAALILEANPDLTPAGVYKILEDNAIDMYMSGYDYDTGYGFVDAYNSVKAAIDSKSSRGASCQAFDYITVRPNPKKTKGSKKPKKTAKGNKKTANTNTPTSW